MEEMAETCNHSTFGKNTAANRERKIVYLVNPAAGTSRKKALTDYIQKVSAERAVFCEILETNKQGDYDFLSEKIEQNNITDVVIIGGDGTVNSLIGALHRLDINFGIIPFGSGNGLARAAGIPSRPKAALRLILDGTAKYVDAFRVNSKFACMLSGMGFDAAVARDFAAKHTRGLLTYTQQSIINYFRAQPYQFEVEAGDIHFFTDAFFISIANGNQFGNNFTIAPEANLSDGLLDVVIVQKMNKAKLPFAILKQIRGNNKLQELVNEITGKNVLYFRVSEIKIKNLKDAPMHIDGEPVPSENEVDIKIIKDCFRLIMP